MKLHRIVLIFMLLISFALVGQNHESTKTVVIYDPLFWKDQLSLRTYQSKQIEQINYEFYEGLRQAVRTPNEKTVLSRKLAQGLRERTEKIWATLDPRQRRKLERIIEKSYLTLRV